jgi:hypothetical protein
MLKLIRILDFAVDNPRELNELPYGASLSTPALITL